MSTLVQRSVLDGGGLPFDQIQIRGIAARGFHGVLESERESGQDFSADVTLFLDTRKAARDDDLDRTVDYGLIAQDVTDILSGPPVNLIETVAEQIAAAVLERDLVLAVEVRIHKPQAPIPVPFDDVVVVIHRDRVSPPAVPSPFVSLDATESPESAGHGPDDVHADVHEAMLAAVAGVPVVEPAHVSVDESNSLETFVADEQPLGYSVEDLAPAPVAEIFDDQADAADLDELPEALNLAPGDSLVESPAEFVELTPAALSPDVIQAPVDNELAEVPVEESNIPPVPAELPEAIAVGAEAPPIPDTYLSTVRPALLTPLELLETRELSIDTAAVRRRTLAAEIPPLDESVLAEQARLSEQARRPEVFGLKPVVIPTPSPSVAPLPLANVSIPPLPFAPPPFEPWFADRSGDAPTQQPDPAPADVNLDPEPQPPVPGNLPGAESPPDADLTMVHDPVQDEMDARPAAPVEAVLALGANLGDAQETLRQAVTALGRLTGVEIMQVGPLARTAAVGVTDQPDFLNTVVIVSTELSARELLHACQSIEADHGRNREVRWGPRTLDIDIIVYGALLGSADDLDLPHARANERAFVLAPWAHIAPDAILPGLGGGPVTALAATAPDRDGIRWLALDWLHDDENPDTAAPTPASIAPAHASPLTASASSPIVVPGSVAAPASAPPFEPPAFEPPPFEPVPGAWPVGAGSGPGVAGGVPAAPPAAPPVGAWPDPAADDPDRWFSRFAPPPAADTVPDGSEGAGTDLQ